MKSKKELNKRQSIRELMAMDVKQYHGAIGRTNNMDVHTKRFFTVREAAEYLRLSTKTVYNRMSLGTFPVKCKRVNRKRILFEISDIVAYANTL